MKSHIVHIPNLLKRLQAQKLSVQSHEQLDDRYCVTLRSGAVISLFPDGEIEVTPPRPNVCIGMLWSRLEEILPRRTRYLRRGQLSAKANRGSREPQGQY